MENQMIKCPFKKLTIKHGSEPDTFGTFNGTFKWCQEHMSQVFTTKFIDETTVEVTFITTGACVQLINILTEYIVRHTFVKSCDGIVKQSQAEIDDENKEVAYAMCTNIVQNFLSSARVLLEWSLQRFFENNDTLNITIYEKLNLKSLRQDFDTILNQPHALNYLFDSLERVILARNTPDEAFLMTALLTKSIIEIRPEFNMNGYDSLHVWLDNGKIAFSGMHNRFGIKEVVCKELYSHGFKPQRDMNSVKIIALAAMFANPMKIIIHKGIATKGVAKFFEDYKGVLGDIEVAISEDPAPNFEA